MIGILKRGLELDKVWAFFHIFASKWILDLSFWRISNFMRNFDDDFQGLMRFFKVDVVLGGKRKKENKGTVTWKLPGAAARLLLGIILLLFLLCSPFFYLHFFYVPFSPNNSVCLGHTLEYPVYQFSAMLCSLDRTKRIILDSFQNCSM